MYIPCYGCSDIRFVNRKGERRGIEKLSAKIFAAFRSFVYQIIANLTLSKLASSKVGRLVRKCCLSAKH